MKKIERNKEQQRHVDESFTALDAAFAQFEKTREVNCCDDCIGAAVFEIGNEIVSTCSQVLAEYFTARAEKPEETPAHEEEELRRAAPATTAVN